MERTRADTVHRPHELHGCCEPRRGCGNEHVENYAEQHHGREREHPAKPLAPIAQPLHDGHDVDHEEVRHVREGSHHFPAGATFVAGEIQVALQPL